MIYILCVRGTCDNNLEAAWINGDIIETGYANDSDDISDSSGIKDGSCDSVTGDASVGWKFFIALCGGCGKMLCL
jgi:hypothetical protein